ncbi:MAG: aldo/keto reductase [Magnetococcales bacterium]|nr:aldo/keto reductase [Magnetococcales bacterium]
MNPLPRIPLGTSDLRITPIGVGTWAIGGVAWGPQRRSDSLAALEYAIAAGVNWVDTAPIYGSGQAEAVLGETLKGLPAERRPYVFSKFGCGSDSANELRCASRAAILAECDASLRRLGIERIDLYQLHWPCPQPIEEAAEACVRLLAAGKIRAVGLCNHERAALDAWAATGVPLATIQTPLSLFMGQAAREVIPWAREHRTGVLAYSPLHRGILFGTWTQDQRFPPGDHRAGRDEFRPRNLPHLLEATNRLGALARGLGISAPRLAVTALFAIEGLTACIVGVRNAAQGKALADLWGPVPDAATRRAIEAILIDLHFGLMEAADHAHRQP